MSSTDWSIAVSSKRREMWGTGFVTTNARPSRRARRAASRIERRPETPMNVSSPRSSTSTGGRVASAVCSSSSSEAAGGMSSSPLSVTRTTRPSSGRSTRSGGGAVEGIGASESRRPYPLRRSLRYPPNGLLRTLTSRTLLGKSNLAPRRLDRIEEERRVGDPEAVVVVVVLHVTGRDRRATGADRPAVLLRDRALDRERAARRAAVVVVDDERVQRQDRGVDLDTADRRSERAARRIGTAV